MMLFKRKGQIVLLDEKQKSDEDKDDEVVYADPVEPWVPEQPAVDLDEIYEK